MRAAPRYQHNDLSTYVDVLGRMDPMSCFPDGMPRDAVLYNVACVEAAYAVPLNDAPAGAFNRERYVRDRLSDAIEYRNRWYANHLPAQGHA